MTDMKAESESVFAFLDALLGDHAEDDYSGALNGLQVEGPARITRVAAAVDASERVLAQAVERGADLLLVHHGLFWDPERRLTGRRFRKVQTLLSGNLALYSSHLPLDRHPEVGNSALLLGALGVESPSPFGHWKALTLGWEGELELPLALSDLRQRLEEAVGGPARVVHGGEREARRIAVVTGAGASFMGEAAENGIDTLITGEAPHHAFQDAHELGINLLLGGHYRTETFGVKAVAERLSRHFGIPWDFIDDPSGF